MNTLVDRIVTGYPKEIAEDIEKREGYADELIDSSEIFHLWVIEGDKKYAGELPFDKIGLNVVWTDDVKPYKKTKSQDIKRRAYNVCSGSYAHGYTDCKRGYGGSYGG